MWLIPPNSVDMILCDLPYGTTQNTWDTVIPFVPLWEQYRRVLKPNGVVALTASQPFTSVVVSSNQSWFKYEWIWRKNNATGHLNAHNMPMKEHENVLVFGPGTVLYKPQGLRLFMKATRRGGSGSNFGKAGTENFQQFTNYPRSVLEFETDFPKLHPTQKPVALFEYLIKTYTNEGDLVLDNCAGSGTTGIACLNTNRRFILIEKDSRYCEVAKKRIAEHEAA
jgi:site-specific DNA-methyltransferase (adenine-specific)